MSQRLSSIAAENVSPAARPRATVVQLVVAEPARETPISTSTRAPAPPALATVPENVPRRKPPTGSSHTTRIVESAIERQRTTTVPDPPEWPTAALSGLSQFPLA